MINNNTKLFCFYFYLLSFLPFLSIFKEEKIISVIGIFSFILYGLMLFINKQFLSKMSFLLFIFITSIFIILLNSNQPLILIPLSLIIYIYKQLDNESIYNKVMYIYTLIIPITSFIYLHDNPITSLINNNNNNIIDLYPYILSMVLTILFHHNSNYNDNYYNVEYEEIKTELEKKDNIINQLENKLKNTNNGLKEENYLAVVIGLDFKGFNYDENVKKIINTVKNSTKAIFTAYYEFDDSDHAFHIKEYIGESYILNKKPIPVGIGAVGTVYNTQQYVLIDNLQEKEKNEYKRKLLNNVNALLVIPIIVNNKIISAVSIGLPMLSKKQELDIVNLCCIISSKASAEFEKLEKHEETEKKSITDKLTGLYNRLYFDTKIKEQFQSCNLENKSLAYVEIDLDYFKQMNDTHGHAFGDKVLQTASKVFKRNIRKSDYAFRTGGDEFGLLLLGVDKQMAFNIVKTIVDDYSNEVEKQHLYAKKDGKDVKSSFSIGIAVYPHENIMSVKELIETADKAVYHVKEHGKNNIAIAK